VKLIIRSIFFIVVVILWLSIRTVFWIALLARELAVFSFAFIYAMFTSQAPSYAGNRINIVIDLYIRGYVSAFDIAFSDQNQVQIEPRTENFLYEILWGMLFWAPIIIGLKFDEININIDLVNSSGIALILVTFIIFLFVTNLVFANMQEETTRFVNVVEAKEEEIEVLNSKIKGLENTANSNVTARRQNKK